MLMENESFKQQMFMTDRKRNAFSFFEDFQECEINGTCWLIHRGQRS